MFYAISWLLSFSLLALWSLTCWSVHAMTSWAVTNADAMVGSHAAIKAITVHPWLQG